MDPVLDVDWIERWRALVAARDATVGPRDLAYWDDRASRYDLSLSGRHEPVVEIVEPWLTPDTTVIDVGAGTGRYSVALAARVRHVLAVEPSHGMRAQIPDLPNLTVLGVGWPPAEVPVADLVLCVNMLYPIADIAPVVTALDRAARERVFVFLRDTESRHPADIVAGGAREPLLRHGFLVLRQLGIAPDVTLYEYGSTYRFANLDAALTDCRKRGGARWDERAGRALLEERLAETDSGDVEFDSGRVVAGVLHWSPRQQG
jgi:SAM-dependent methyltransferase